MEAGEEGLADAIELGTSHALEHGHTGSNGARCESANYVGAGAWRCVAQTSPYCRERRTERKPLRIPRRFYRVLRHCRCNPVQGATASLAFTATPAL